MKLLKKLTLAAMIALASIGCEQDSHHSMFEDPMFKDKVNDSIQNERTNIQINIARKDNSWKKQEKFKILNEMIYKVPAKLDTTKEYPLDSFYLFPNHLIPFSYDKYKLFILQYNDADLVFLKDTITNKKEFAWYETKSSNTVLPYGLRVGNAKKLADVLLGPPEIAGLCEKQYIYPSISSKKDILIITGCGDENDDITKIQIIHDAEKNKPIMDDMHSHSYEYHREPNSKHATVYQIRNRL